MEVKAKARHAGGNWSIGKAYGAIVTDEPYLSGVRGYDDVEAYGGYLIAESVAECNRPLLSATKDMYDILEQMVERYLEWSKKTGLTCHLMSKAATALAKARGDIT